MVILTTNLRTSRNSLGTNAFGIEDLFGLGDADYDDVIVDGQIITAGW